MKIIQEREKRARSLFWFEQFCDDLLADRAEDMKELKKAVMRKRLKRLGRRLREAARQRKEENVAR